MVFRSLKSAEYDLLSHLLNLATNYSFNQDILTNIRVSEYLDAGTSSLKIAPVFSSDTHRIFAEQISECVFEDQDGVPIVVSLNIDKNGDLFELDIWKVDFSDVIQYPKP